MKNQFIKLAQTLYCQKVILIAFFILFLEFEIKTMDKSNNLFMNDSDEFELLSRNLETTDFINLNPLAWELSRESEIFMQKVLQGISKIDYIFKCRYCNSVSDTRRLLVKHIKKDHPKKKAYLCFIPGCNYAASHSNTLSKHRKKKHR